MEDVCGVGLNRSRDTEPRIVNFGWSGGIDSGSDRKTLACWVVIGHYPIIGTGAICVSNNEGGVDVFSLNLIIRIGGKRGFYNQDDRAGKGGFSRYWVWIEKVSGICRVLINCCRHVPAMLRCSVDFVVRRGHAELSYGAHLQSLRSPKGWGSLGCSSLLFTVRLAACWS